MRSGGEPPEDTVEWPYFKSLLFLRDIFEKRTTAGNLSDLEENNGNLVDNSDEDPDRQITDNEITSPPPTPSSHISSIGCSSEATINVHSCSTNKASIPSRKVDLGYRKRSSQMDIIGKNLLALEKEKIEMKKSKVVSNIDRNDEDVAFFTSLLPHVRKLSPVEKLQFRIKVQTILMATAYKNTISDTTENRQATTSTTFHSRPTPEPPTPMMYSTTDLPQMEQQIVEFDYTTLQPRGFDYNNHNDH